MRETSKIAIIDQDDKLFQLLSKGKNPFFDFVLFNNIKNAQEYISSSKVICVLTETIINNNSTAPVVQTIKKNKNTINYRVPIIIYSANVNKGFISRIKDKVLGAFKKPMISENSIRKFIPFLVHIYKQKQNLESEVASLKQFHSIIFKNISEYIQDELAQNHINIQHLKGFFSDLETKSTLYGTELSPHHEDAYQDSFDQDKLQEILNSIPLSERNETTRAHTTENIGLYKAAQKEIHDINQNLENSFLVDPEMETEEETLPSTPSVEAIFKAIVNDDRQTIQTYIQQGVKFNVANIDGDTPLHSVTKLNRSEIFKLFLNLKLPLNIPNNNGQTPLILTTVNDNKAFCFALIKLGADLNIRDTNGDTALMHACKSGAVEVAKQLIENGAKQDITSNKNETAVQIAANNGHQSIVSLLVQNLKKSA